jgi:hypothetical protein
MNDAKRIYAIVEGQTEQKFIKEVLAPYLAPKNIYLCATILKKSGENGGDVKFSRAKNDIGNFLKQSSDVQVTLMVDYYGISEWPGYAESKKQSTHTKKHKFLMDETSKEVQKLFPDKNPQARFIPYFSMYEIEALYFCNPEALAKQIGVKKTEIDAIVSKCGEPENINDSSATSPSKRLKALSQSFKKTLTGISIAKEIGIKTMRDRSPLFDAWITQLEN